MLQGGEVLINNNKTYMNRRDFIRKSITTGIAAGASFGIFRNENIFASVSSSEGYGLAAVKGGEPDIMFKKGIEALGGISKFVMKGQKVLVKPNIAWDLPPERAANTNPLLVKTIVKACLQAGAKEVVVMDHTCHEWTKAYANSGIEKAVKDAGGTMAPANAEGYYQNVEISKAKILKTTKVHEAILNADVFINVPVLKHHSGSKVSISMKNLMGNVWERKPWHRDGLHQCIADFTAYKKPTLNVVDAYRVMMRNGPKGLSEEDTLLMKSLIISPDIVAADAAATKLFGLEPDDVGHITYAHDMGLGNKNLGEIKIKKISL